MKVSHLPKLPFQGYKLIKDESVAEDEEKATNTSLHSPSPRDRCYRLISWTIFGLGCILILFQRREKPTDRQCAAQTSVWSPLNEAVEYEGKNYENYFSHESEFRGPPTPELEQKWSTIIDFPSISIPHSKIGLLNRSAAEEDFVEASAPGQSGYIAGVEVFHHLHCLNYIRQYTWLDYYETVPVYLSHGPVLNRMYVDHCIETIRLALMYNADLTPYLIRSRPDKLAGAESDFSAYHKCKRFDLITDWMEKNAFKQALGVPHEH